MYAPTFLKTTIILEFLHGFVGATLRGRPIILAKIRIPAFMGCMLKYNCIFCRI
jgi:hypothetical protein